MDSFRESPVDTSKYDTSSKDIHEDKSDEIHSMDSGKERDRPGNQGDKFREKYSEYSIFLEKRLALFEIFWIQEAFARVEHLTSIAISEEIVDHVSDERSDNRGDEYWPYMEYSYADKNTRWDEYEFSIPEKRERESSSKEYPDSDDEIGNMWTIFEYGLYKNDNLTHRLSVTS